METVETTPAIKIEITNTAGGVDTLNFPLTEASHWMSAAGEKGVPSHFSVSKDEGTALEAAKYTCANFYGPSWRFLEAFNELLKSDSKKVQQYVKRLTATMGSAVDEMVRLEYKNMSIEQITLGEALMESAGRGPQDQQEG